MYPGERRCWHNISFNRPQAERSMLLCFNHKTCTRALCRLLYSRARALTCQFPIKRLLTLRLLDTDHSSVQYNFLSLGSEAVSTDVLSESVCFAIDKYSQTKKKNCAYSWQWQIRSSCYKPCSGKALPVMEALLWKHAESNEFRIWWSL